MARVWLFGMLTVEILTVLSEFLRTLAECIPLAAFPLNVGEDREMDLENQSPIRVMRIIARMNVGGPAVQVSGLMRGFNPTEFDHRLYTGFCDEYEADYLETVAIDVTAVRIEGFGRRVSLAGDIRAFIALVKEIREFKPHIVHTHTAKAGFLGRIASIVSLQPSIRVHTFHGHLLNGYFGNFKRSLIVMTEKILAIFTDQLLAVGDKVRQDLLQARIGNKEKFGLMPPGLSLGTLAEKSESQQSFGLSASRPQCAFIGRVTQIKRPDRFLDVVSEVKGRGVGLDFFMAGDGELLEVCRERITRENLPVKVLGWQNDIEKVLSAADIVVLTSDNEGTPLTLIQAGMAGLPVVTTNVGSVPEVVLDGVTGIITNLDIQEIANALVKQTKDKALRERLGLAAQEFTLANFGVQRLVHDHEELYKKLLVSRAKS
jgi:glycosyltransferase involved in cell wall biosynthesis